MLNRINESWVRDQISKGIVNIVIPEGVTHIEDEAFRGCTDLVSIMFPEGLKRIGYDVFSGCSSLTSIMLPKRLESIGDAVFYRCTGLTSITLPETLESIGGAAFRDCTGLTSIMLPETLKSIGPWTFYGCSGLTSIMLPDMLKRIGYYAFNGCTGLKSLSIPSHLDLTDHKADLEGVDIVRRGLDIVISFFSVDLKPNIVCRTYRSLVKDMALIAHRVSLGNTTITELPPLPTEMWNAILLCLSHRVIEVRRGTPRDNPAILARDDTNVKTLVLDSFESSGYPYDDGIRFCDASK